MERFIYGIDFGTTNSSLSIYDREEQVIVKTISIPSLIFFPSMISHGSEELSCFCGKEAIEEYVSSKMSGRFIKSFKKVLSNENVKHAYIYGEKYSIPRIVSLIISDLKRKADAIVGQEVKTVVAGRPVIFDEDKQKDNFAEGRLVAAFKIAGFERIYLQLEPIAAALTYERIISKDETVLVADFGGGTSDFSIIKLSPNKIFNQNRKEDIVDSSGIYIGGDTFDSSFMWEVGTPHFGRGVKYESYGKKLDIPLSFFTNICAWEKMIFFNSIKIKNTIGRYQHSSNNNPRIGNLLKLIRFNLGYSIFQSIEQTKIELSTKESTTFSFEKRSIKINEFIDQAKYNSIIEENVLKIKGRLDDFLSKNSDMAHEISSVFVTGGTANVGIIKRLLEDTFGPEKVRYGNLFSSVSEGLAYGIDFFETSESFKEYSVK